MPAARREARVSNKIDHSDPVQSLPLRGLWACLANRGGGGGGGGGRGKPKGIPDVFRAGKGPERMAKNKTLFSIRFRTKMQGNEERQCPRKHCEVIPGGLFNLV